MQDTATVREADRHPGQDVDPEEDATRLLEHLRTRTGGLDEREAARRLLQVGPNEIRRETGPPWWRAVVDQFVHPLALLLWLAAGLSLLTSSYALAAAIIVVIVLNAAFAFVQERQAEHATEALRDLLPATARVRRGGALVEVAATSLVPGDLLLLAEGDRLSADARLISGDVEVDLSPLTGESQPVSRTARRIGPPAPPLEAEDLVFAGTLCTGGDGQAVVYGTGMHTQLGRIAALSQTVVTESSPLQRQVNKAAKLIALVAIGLGVAFFVVGHLVAGLSLSDAGVFAIGLLVANVPEGLLPTITLALAVGVRRMARRRALVKKLTAVETLGSTDVICTDKTGTLTEGRMTGTSLWQDGVITAIPSGTATPPVTELLRAAVFCNNATLTRDGTGWSRSGDPSESALLLAAAELGVDVPAIQDARDRDRLRLFAFDARLKRMATLDRAAAGPARIHAKGAPLGLLEHCTTVRTADGGERPLDAAGVAAVTAAFHAYAADGLRVLGIAGRDAPDVSRDRADDRDLAESGLCFLGLIAMRDPLRPQVPAAVADCRRAGIRIIVITGDDGLTAGAIAREAGIVDGDDAQVVTGPELDALDDAGLDRVLRDSPHLIVARSSPEAKLRIVDGLRAQGHTVAMTGDGVNDAPALRRADIGIAMGASGTDVAREAADMVLTDDDFASIVAAVKEGRTVYDNIRKFVVYIFAHATPEMIPFLLYALSGGNIPLPLTALMILAIDLGTETLPALALGREPAEPGLMDQPPRPRTSGILTRSMLVRAWLWLGLLEAVLVMGGFFFVLVRAGWSPGDATGPGTDLHGAYLQATTMTFAGITMCQVGTAFAARTSRASLRQIGLFTNPMLLWGIAFELVFAAALIWLPPLQDVFRTASLGVAEVAILLTFPFVVWGSDELRRAAVRRRAGAPTEVVRVHG
ncbi:cation-transporting P-type ATPase [Patulibacter sp.]|uniref:cation-translocating P-type ATPase n=1 Tax=Patulibacter sp. TaxID=1912859 RepID=UPI00272065A1|nr:cation-transporting P-type ATPase [Patulibacter sp.]MDO9410888.1 cation-transporting P-type ATPase [Patulibacter sp.]